MLWEVERYLRQSGMSATRFGRMVANDPRLVHDMRRGRMAGRRMTGRIRAAIIGDAAHISDWSSPSKSSLEH